MRFLLLALLLAGTATAHAQGDVKGRTLDLRGQSIDLVPKTIDLRFAVEDLGGKAQDVSGKTQDLQVKESTTETRIDLAADVLFDFDKAVLLSKAQGTLHDVAVFISENGKGRPVRIEGYTDSKGSDSYNQKLSQRRADAVKQWLAQKERLNVSMTTEGFGAKRPVASNTKPDGSDDPDGRQKNRRVEIVIAK